MRTQNSWLLASLSVFAAMTFASAQNNWSGASSGNWSVAGNWSGGVPNGNGTSGRINLAFGDLATGATTTMTDDISTNPFILNEMTFSAISAQSAYTLAGTAKLQFTTQFGVAPTLVMNSSNGVTFNQPLALSNTFTVSGMGAGALALTGNISGSGSLNMSAADTLTLGGTNIYLGGTVVTSGTLALTNGLAIPTNGSLTVSGGGVFYTGGQSNTAASALGTVSVSGGGSIFVPVGSSGNYYLNQLVMTAGTVDLSNVTNYALHLTGSGAQVTTNMSSTGAVWKGSSGASISNDTGSPVNITVTGGGPGLAGIDLDCGLALTGSGFTKIGGGLMRLTNPNSTAPVTLQFGYLRIDDSSSGSQGCGAFGTGTFTLNGGNFVYGGTSGSTSKPIALGGSGGLIGILNPGTTWTLNGVISQPGSSTGINVNGLSTLGITGAPSTLVFNASNTYTSLTLIQDNATLQIPTITIEGSGTTGTTASPIGQSNNTPGNLLLGDPISSHPNGRGTLMLTGTNTTYTTDRGATLQSQYASGAGGGAIGVQNATTTLNWNGQITGGGALVKVGAGILVLGNTSSSAPNNYSGGTFVEGGTLTMGNASAIPSGSNITVQSGGTFKVGTGTDTHIGTLTLNGGGVVNANGAGSFLDITNLVTDSGGGTVNLTSGAPALSFLGSGSSITINGNSTWNGALASMVENVNVPSLPVTIAPNVTVTSALSLTSDGGASSSFLVSGGGTLHLTNRAQYPAYVTVNQATLQMDDSAGFDQGFGVVGVTNITLDGGTLKYTGGTTSGSHPGSPPITLFSLTGNGGTFDVEGNIGLSYSKGFVIAGPAGAVVTKTGAGTFVIDNGSNPALPGGVNVVAGTFGIGAGNALPAGANVTVQSGAVFDVGAGSNDPSMPIGTVTLNGGTLHTASANYAYYSLNKIVTGPAGGTVNANDGGSAGGINFEGAGAGITINGNSTWTGTGAFSLVNGTLSELPITIAPNVTLACGLTLQNVPNYPGFVVNGGGTLWLTDPFDTYSPTYIRVNQARLRMDFLGYFAPQVVQVTLDNGTLQYGGGTNSYPASFTVTANGGTVEVLNSTAALTVTGAIVGGGPLTKAGPGTLVLGSAGNAFSSLYVSAGTLQTANDNTLAFGPVSVGPLGTLLYSANTTTSRTFNLLDGTLAVSAGQTLTLQNATIGGGFLVGNFTTAAGGSSSLVGTTIAPATVVALNGSDFLTNVSQGGQLNLAASSAATLSRVTNQGSGSITLAAGAHVNASEFQSYGLLTIAPATGTTFTQLPNTGATPLYFNGGSRTFIGTPATAGTFVAGIDLHGQNAVVAGGLFVNNGFVADLLNGTGVVVADYGALVKGAGFFQNSPVTQNGGRVQAGNSPGSASFGQLTFGPGGVSNYVFAIDDAAGTAGPIPNLAGQVSGWGLMKSVQRLVGTTTTSGDFTWTADPTDKLTFALETLVNPTTVGTDVTGLMANFDPSRPYSWPAVTWSGAYTGPTEAGALDASTIFDTGGFENPIAGAFGWSLDSAGQTLSLTYTPSAVPEPGSLALAGWAAFGAAAYLRRRRVA